MKKLKWKYIKSRKVWETTNTYDGRYMQIGRTYFYERGYVLRWGRFHNVQPIGTFKKLTKAKVLAQLIYEG